jgi:biotin-(acetyl-CoA carboxylase) ligase
VNDLFLKDKKIAGALIKSDIFDDKTNLQIGIGINVLVSPL